MLNFSYKNALLNKIPQYVEHVPLVVEKEEKEEKVIEEKVQDNPLLIPLKKKAVQIFVKKDSIPLKDDILRLCSHGLYLKIKNIHNSHFTEENVKFYIHYMHQKIDEIKVWKKEEKNKNEASQKRFKNRIYHIYKTINVMKEKHLEHISDTIVQDEVVNGKWEKIGKEESNSTKEKKTHKN